MPHIREVRAPSPLAPRLVCGPPCTFDIYDGEFPLMMPCTSLDQAGTPLLPLTGTLMAPLHDISGVYSRSGLECSLDWEPLRFPLAGLELPFGCADL